MEYCAKMNQDLGVSAESWFDQTNNVYDGNDDGNDDAWDILR